MVSVLQDFLSLRLSAVKVLEPMYNKALQPLKTIVYIIEKYLLLYLKYPAFKKPMLYYIQHKERGYLLW